MIYIIIPIVVLAALALNIQWLAILVLTAGVLWIGFKFDRMLEYLRNRGLGDIWRD